MFTLKKILGQLLLPYAQGILILLVGLALLWFTRRQRLGRALVTLGAVFLLLAGSAPVAGGLSRLLDASYPPLVETAQLPPVEWIVVLGSGHSQGQVPPTMQLSSAALSRLVEGVRLHRQLPGTRLLLSGYGDPVPHARVLGEAALALGVPAGALVLEERARDTDDEARLIAERLGEAPFLLVTSSTHMKRALREFEVQGARPIPAPADHPGRGGRPTLESFFPGARSLVVTERAAHEFWGLLASLLARPGG